MCTSVTFDETLQSSAIASPVPSTFSDPGAGGRVQAVSDGSAELAPGFSARTSNRYDESAASPVIATPLALGPRARDRPPGGARIGVPRTRYPFSVVLVSSQLRSIWVVETDTACR